LKPSQQQCSAQEAGAARAVGCELAAHAVVRVRIESLAELRRHPGPVHGVLLSPAFLKHADEQTVAGLAAVYHAIHDHGLSGTVFRDWGVLAAPRFLGRPAMAAALQRFAAEGAWGVSPHLIPHRSLHSISGTVSQALKIHGPNFGVGGGPGAAREALLGALSMLGCRRLPGLWVVLTGLDPEAAPDEGGRPAPGTAVVGLALALSPAGTTPARARLSILRSLDSPGSPERSEPFDLLRLEALLARLHADGRGEEPVSEPLDAALRLELSALSSQLSARPEGPVPRSGDKGMCLLPS
jgi:hypothetical protein